MDKVYQDESADGLKTSAHVEEDGTIHFAYEQDSTAAFEAVKADRDRGDGWQNGMKQSFVKALHVPNGVVMELWAMGVNIYTAPAKEIVAGLRKLNRYEACDMTGKRIA